MEESTEFIIKQTVTESLHVDRELADEIRDLTKLCIGEAKAMMKFGLADQKMKLMSTVLGTAVRSVGRDFQTTENEGRVAIDNIFRSMRELPEATDAAPLAALAPRVDDSDERSDH